MAAGLLLEDWQAEPGRLRLALRQVLAKVPTGARPLLLIDQFVMACHLLDLAGGGQAACRSDLVGRDAVASGNLLQGFACLDSVQPARLIGNREHLTDAQASLATATRRSRQMWT